MAQALTDTLLHIKDRLDSRNDPPPDPIEEARPRGPFHLTRLEQKLVVFAFLLCLLARGSSLFSATFSVDDLWYWPVSLDFSTFSGIAFREGRFFGPFVVEFLNALGINAARTFTLSAAALMACQSVTAVLLCRLWKIDDDWRICVIAVATLVLHPYQADLSTWKISQFPGGIPFVMVFWALVVCNLGVAWLAGSIALIVLAFGIHQIPLEMASGALLLGVPLALVRGRFDRAEWIRQVFVLGAGSVVYVIAAKLVIAHTVHADTVGRDKIILLSNPGLVLARSRELLLMIVRHDPLSGWLTRAVLAALAALCLVRIALAKESSILVRLSHILIFVVAICGAFLCAISLTVVPQSWMPVFRNLLSIELIWAFIGAIVFSISGARLQKVVAVGVVVILLGFVGSNNEVLSDQQRVNQRDIATMNRIATDVGALENAVPIRRILFVGTNSSSLSGINTAADLSDGWHSYGTTLSVFSVWWPGYLVQLYNEVTGAEVGYTTTPDEEAWAEGYCTNRRWPEKDSISRRDDLVAVCLGAPAKFVPGPYDK